jgi:hypothetical protein
LPTNSIDFTPISIQVLICLWVVATLAALNEQLEAADLLDDTRVITGRPVTVGAAFTIEREALMGLPSEAFDPAKLLQSRVDKRARISVRQCYYSVPVRYAGRRLAVRLSARTVEVFDGAKARVWEEEFLAGLGDGRHHLRVQVEVENIFWAHYDSGSRRLR